MISDNGMFSMLNLVDVNSYRIAFRFFDSNHFKSIYRSFHVFSTFPLQTFPLHFSSFPLQTIVYIDTHLYFISLR